MYIPTTQPPNGTSLKGYVQIGYKELVSLFGEPNCEGDGYKVSTEWVLKEVPDDKVQSVTNKLDGIEGEIVTLYDYKYTELYSKGGITVEQFRSLPKFDWHVGAKSEAAYFRLKQYIESKQGE